MRIATRGNGRRRERSSWWVAPALAGLLAVVLTFVGRPGIGLAATPCTYAPRTVTVPLVGEPVTLSVGSQGEILVNGLPCPDVTAVDTPFPVAMVDTTGAIDVIGTDATDIVVIDETGGAFPSILTFRLDLRFDVDDRLEVVGTTGADHITALAFALHLDGDAGGGDVQLGGVDRVRIDAGPGDDRVDASLTDVDSPDFSIPLTILGGDGNDQLTGGDGDDRLYGQGGNDVLDGNDGTTDFLNGGIEPSDQCRYGADPLPCDPSITLTPSEGTAETPVTVDGSGWYPENGLVSISFGEQAPSASVQPGPDGSLPTTDLDISAAPDGNSAVTVTACQQCQDDIEPVRATTDFTYAAQPTDELTLEVTTNPVPFGRDVPVSGTGWIAGEPVSLFVDPADGALGEAPATAIPDPNGILTASLAPQDLGEHRLVACQRCGAADERRFETTFRIEAIAGVASIQVQPDTASVGDQIEVIGSGWDRERGRVHLFLGSPAIGDREVDTFRPDPNSGFDVTVDVPNVPAGSYTVTACQRCSVPGRIDATRLLAIESAASLPIPWIAGGAALLLLLLAGAFALFRRPKPPSPGEQDDHHPSPEARVAAHARPSAPAVSISREPDGTSDHRVRLVPRPDRGTQRVEEMSHP